MSENVESSRRRRRSLIGGDKASEAPEATSPPVAPEAPAAAPESPVESSLSPPPAVEPAPTPVLPALPPEPLPIDGRAPTIPSGPGAGAPSADHPHRHRRGLVGRAEKTSDPVAPVPPAPEPAAPVHRGLSLPPLVDTPPEPVAPVSPASAAPVTSSSPLAEPSSVSGVTAPVPPSFNPDQAPVPPPSSGAAPAEAEKEPTPLQPLNEQTQAQVNASRDGTLISVADSDTARFFNAAPIPGVAPASFPTEEPAPPRSAGAKAAVAGVGAMMMLAIGGGVLLVVLIVGAAVMMSGKGHAPEALPDLSAVVAPAHAAVAAAPESPGIVDLSGVGSTPSVDDTVLAEDAAPAAPVVAGSAGSRSRPVSAAPEKNSPVAEGWAAVKDALPERKDPPPEGEGKKSLFRKK